VAVMCWRSPLTTCSALYAPPRLLSIRSLPACPSGHLNAPGTAAGPPAPPPATARSRPTRPAAAAPAAAAAAAACARRCDFCCAESPAARPAWAARRPARACLRVAVAAQSRAMTTLRIAMLRFGTWGDRKCSLNEGQITTFRVVSVHVSTGYNRAEGNRRASRNGRVSELPPENLTYDSQLLHRCSTRRRPRSIHILCRLLIFSD
jgi:hypothetical protein